MNIAVITKTRFPIREPFAGGLEAFTHMICSEYIAHGHTVTLYAHADSDPRLNVRSFYGDEFRDSAQAGQYETDEYLSIVKDIEAGGYDIVHNNSSHHVPLIWGARAKIPVVTTLHTPPYTTLKAATSLASYSNNLQFVSVSKSLQKHWRPFIHRDISVIHNGIDIAKWEFQRTPANYLFWYGRITRNKGLDIALDLAHDCELPLQFAGPITDSAYYTREIEPRIHPRDSYKGHLRQAELKSCLASAQAFVTPVRWEEPFGLSTIEAMATGTPVVGFDRGAFREIVDTSGGIIADGTNIASLKRALEKTKTLSQSDIKARAQSFRLDRVGQQYLQFFEELL